MSDPDPMLSVPEALGLKVIPVIDEALSVGIRAVERGGYRISKHVAEREEVVDELLRSYEVSIERVAMAQLLPMMEHPPSRQEGDVWVIPVVEEVLVTEKRLLLKEEIRVTRIESTFRQPQTVSLRREEISVERLEP